MKRTSITLTVLLLLVAACRVGPVSTTVPSPTTTMTALATAKSSPTALPTLPPISTSAPTATLALPPMVWRILFTGFPCNGLATCSPFSDTEFHYYSINSDGTNLQLVDISWPDDPLLPPGSPPRQEAMPYPKLSPDGDLLAYAAYVEEAGLYVTPATHYQPRLVLGVKDVPGAAGRLGPFCWTPDGSGIRADIRREQDGQWMDVFYNIDINNGDAWPLFNVVGFGTLLDFGDCSPDNHELAFSISESAIEGAAGLYILALDSGAFRQILTGYYVSAVRTAPAQ